MRGEGITGGRGTDIEGLWMFGLIVLLIIAAYLAISVMVVKKTMRWAQASGRRARRWGWVAGLTMYLLVFWDLIPTIALHQYLCATEQGLWIYKTVEEWQRENPGVAETLTPYTGVHIKSPGVADAYLLNERFANELLAIRKPLFFLPVSIHETRIVDRATDEVMAKHVSIGSGYGDLSLGSEGSWKFWLEQPNCNDDRKRFSAYVTKLKFQEDKK